MVASLLIFFPFFEFLLGIHPAGQSSLPRTSGIPRSTPAPAASVWRPVLIDAPARHGGGGRAQRLPKRANAWKPPATTSGRASPAPSRNGRHPTDARESAAASGPPARQMSDPTA